MELKPIGNRVAVRLRPAPTHVGAIALVDRYAERPMIGDVVAVGTECKFVRENDVIYMRKQAGIELPKLRARGDDETFLIVRESEEILAILDVKEEDRMLEQQALEEAGAKAALDEVRRSMRAYALDSKVSSLLEPRPVAGDMNPDQARDEAAEFEDEKTPVAALSIRELAERYAEGASWEAAVDDAIDKQKDGEK